jgi:hypothetical protein
MFDNSAAVFLYHLMPNKVINSTCLNSRRESEIASSPDAQTGQPTRPQATATPEA